MRDEALVLVGRTVLVEVLELHAACFGMGSEVKVGSVRKAVEFLSSEREVEFEVGRRLGIVGKVRRFHLELVDLRHVDADFVHPFEHRDAKLLKLGLPF